MSVLQDDDDDSRSAAPEAASTDDSAEPAAPAGSAASPEVAEPEPGDTEDSASGGLYGSHGSHDSDSPAGDEDGSGDGDGDEEPALVLPPSIPPRRHPAPVITPARRRGHRVLARLAVVVLALVIVGLFKTFVLQTFEIPSASMEETLHVGDQVAVTMYDSEDVRRGDVIVFTDPGGWLDVTEPTGPRRLLQDTLVMLRLLPQDTGYHLIKRVIGVGGDRVVADGSGTITVNGKVLDETYLPPGESSSLTAFDVTVPEGHVWVMGDNRSNSADSRYHQDDPHGGAVPHDSVVGVARGVVWPVGRWHVLDEGRQVFADVPEAAPASAARSTASSGASQ